jgi:hypothetical protein
MACDDRVTAANGVVQVLCEALVGHTPECKRPLASYLSSLFARATSNTVWSTSLTSV